MCLASAVGFFLLTIAFLACGIGFLAPYWVYFPGNVVDEAGLDNVNAKRIKYDGMLGRCFDKGDCVYFFQHAFEMEKEVQGKLSQRYHASKYLKYHAWYGRVTLLCGRRRKSLEKPEI